MNKSSRVKLTFVVLEVLLAVSSSIKGVEVGQSSPKDGTAKVNMKLQVSLSLDNPDAYSSEPRVVRIRITNVSHLPLSVSALKRVDFTLFKYHRENKYLSPIGELFLSRFTSEDFEAVSPARELPKELKSNEQLEFKVNLSKGVWSDLTASFINLDEAKGFRSVASGHYFITAEAVLWPGAAAENRATFESNEIEIRIQ